MGSELEKCHVANSNDSSDWLVLGEEIRIRVDRFHSARCRDSRLHNPLETNLFNRSSLSPAQTQNAPYNQHYVPQFLHLIVCSGEKKGKWVRGVFLLGRPHDSRNICFIRLFPRMTDYISVRLEKKKRS